MTKLQQAIRKTRRRTLANGIIRHAGQGALAAAAAAVLLLAVDRLADLGLSWIIYAALAAAGLIAGAVVALARQRGALAAAVHLDRALHLKDRIGSAAQLETTPGRDAGFAQLVKRDAEHFAGRIDVRQAVPITIPRLWAGVLGAFVLVALGFALIPPVKRTPSGPDPAVVAAQQQALEQQREVIVEEIAQAVEQVREQEEALPTEAREELAALDRLAEQLSGRPPSEKELNDARDESTARLNELAERLAERSQRAQAAADEVAERFRQLETPETPMSAEEFTRALQRGEFDDAAAALEKLLEQREALSEAERQAISEHLKRISDAAREGDAGPQQQLDERKEQIAQALRDQGLDERQVEEILEPQPTEQREEKLREQPIDEEIARKLARDLRELNERQETLEQAEQQSQDLADALDEAQRELEQPSAPGEVPPPPPPAPDTPPEQTPDQTPDQTPQPTPPDSQQQQPQPPQPGDTSQQQQPQQQQPGAEPQQTQQGQQPQPTGAEQPQPQPGGEQPDPQQPEQQPGETTEQREVQQPGAQPQPVPPPAPGEQQQQQQQEQQQTAPDQQLPSSPEQQPIVKPGETPSEQPQPGGAMQQPQPDPTQPQATPSDTPELPQLPENPPPADMLRRLAERMREADKQQQTSERLREMARRLAENMSDEQKQRWAEQWRKAMEDQPPTPPDPEQQQQTLEQQMQEQLTDREQLPGGPGAGDQKPAERPPGEAPLPSSYSAEDIEEVDARGEEVGDRVLAEWLSDESSEGDPLRRGAAESGAVRVRRAKELAERAVDDSAVPARYHELIRRYFGRLDETAKKASRNKEDGGS